MANTGLAFSGGGIRSAAFCSGVLQRLLERGVEVDFLSCVSGGGYTGTAYLDWKYREERKARTKAEEGEETELVQGKENDWYEDFFNHMTQRSGYICNWMEPLKGILDTLVFSCLVMMVTVIQPIIKWGSYACPVAYIIEYFFGKLMRDAADCDAELADASTSSSREEEIDRCQDGTDDVYTVILFIALFILFSTCYVLLRLIKRSCRMLKIFLHLSQYIFGSFFVLTFIPFTIYDFFTKIPLWAQIFGGVIAVIIWIVLPLLRTKTSYVLIIYFYSYVIYWKVYQHKLFGLIGYSHSLFHWLLGVSGIALWMVPLASTVQERLVHVYNRWRLQKAFYHKDALGPCRCSGIGVQDICPLFTCLRRNEQQSTDATRPLTLADLKGMKPEYLSNMVVNRWKISHDCKEKYELLIMSPTGIERFDRDPNKKQFEGRLEPEDVMLSDAMATSAAALSTHMGKYDRSITGLTRLYTILDLEMGATMVTNVKSLKQESMAFKIAAYLLHILRGLPLIAVPAFYVYDDSAATTVESSIKATMIIFLIIHIVLAIIALIDTGASEPRWWERLARWFIVHNSFVYYAREIFAKNNIGPVPPPVMLLSDGGHVENLAILPLLKKRLPRIVVVDGGYKGGDTFYGECILNAMHLARTKLKCSFFSEDGKDVILDLREKLAREQNGGNPRHYKFKVYYQSDEAGDDGEGEILLIMPKNSQPYATDCVETDVGELHRDTAVIDLHGLDEPEGMFHDDVSKLTLCCCECCHRKSCQWLSKILCNVFPQTNTANQFFTPRMFSAYHHEGYRACVEANADDFLRAVITERQQCASCE